MSGDRPAVICPGCGSENEPSASDCWLCGLVLQVEVVQGSKQVDDSLGPKSAVSWTQYSLMSGLLWITLAAVWLGVFVAAPGLGILLGIAVLPAFVRTLLVTAARGRPVSTVEKITLFVGSLVTVVISAAVVLVASVGTFCAVCLTAGTQEAIPFALLAAAVATIVAIIPIGYWVWRRWQRDVGRK